MQLVYYEQKTMRFLADLKVAASRKTINKFRHRQYSATLSLLPVINMQMTLDYAILVVARAPGIGTRF
jgi:hypothetical protein